MHENFMRSNEPEPHASRRRMIIAKYPQIAALEGPCWKTKYICLFMIVTQLVCAWWCVDKAWYTILMLAWVVGGTINHACSLASHELSHNLAFENPTYNRILALLTDIPKTIPSAVTFRRYHLEHHAYQGVDGVDVDVPTDMEARVVGHNPVLKFLYVVFQVFFYALRPLVIRPKAPGKWEFYNYAVVITSDLLVYHFFGHVALLYLLLSSLIGHGFHPCAGHFISEHFVFVTGYETYSYYGPLNYLTFNVGYHNEHHDFARIPGSRLPELRKIASEFYKDLPYHTSWTQVLYEFITNPKIGLNSRITRSRKTMGTVRDE